jgi:hypothetical protein
MSDDERRDDAESGGDEGAARAREQADEVEKAKEEIHELEEGDPPEKLEDWPTGRAKYLTYGGPEGTAGYDEGPTKKLGPSSLEHHEDGSVTIEGEEVDDPGEFKSDEPVPGAPDAAKEHAERSEEQGEDDEGDGDADDRQPAASREGEDEGDRQPAAAREDDD